MTSDICTEMPPRYGSTKGCRISDKNLDEIYSKMCGILMTGHNLGKFIRNKVNNFQRLLAMIHDITEKSNIC